MTSFVEIEFDTDPERVEESVYEAFQSRFPDWEPAEGNLETWLAKAVAFIWADLAGLAVDVPAEVFHRFGEKILAVEPLEAASATGETTWTMVDDAGYTIPAGTQVEIAISGDESVGFRTVAEVQVAAGDTVTATGEVLIEAVIEGEDANDLDANPTLIDALDFVSGIVLEDPTSGGTVAEDPNDYLDRLAAEAQLLSTRPILPRDVETLARRISGVHRALALDGYDAVAETDGNEKTLSVAVIDEDGNDLSAPVKAEVDALLEAEREVNFVFYVIDPTRTTVDVEVTAVALEGYDPDDVDAAIVAAVTNYLSPASWGTGPIDPDSRTWREIDTVRRNELIALADNVAGVDYVTNVQLALGGDPLGTLDISLDTPAPLPEAGDITATVT